MSAPAPSMPRARWWTRVASAPISEEERHTTQGRERLRQTQMVAAVIPVVLLIPLLLLPIAVLNTATRIGVAIDATLIVVAFLLNRAGQIRLAGILLVGSLFLTMASSLFAIPGGLSLIWLPIFNALTMAIVLAGALLGRVAVWLTAGIAAAFIMGITLSLPLAPDLAAFVQQFGYFPLFPRVVLEFAFVAGIASVTSIVSQRAILRAERAEEVNSVLQRMDDLKDQFVSHINHEIRVPLMSMTLLLDAMVQAPEQVGITELRVMAAALQTSHDQLTALVETILQGQRAAFETSVHVGAANLYDIVTTALHLVPLLPHDQATERELRLYIAHNVVAAADPIRLQQVVINLVSNALKYSPPGSPIEITATSWPTTTTLSVRDYGQGIPPDQIPVLFGRFVRLERDLASATPGTGLGLFHCKQLVEAMHGHIWAESRGIEGEGSTFTVQLPIPIVPEGT